MPLGRFTRFPFQVPPCFKCNFEVGPTFGVPKKFHATALHTDLPSWLAPNKIKMSDFSPWNDSIHAPSTTPLIFYLYTCYTDFGRKKISEWSILCNSKEIIQRADFLELRLTSFFPVRALEFHLHGFLLFKFSCRKFHMTQKEYNYLPWSVG